MPVRNALTVGNFCTFDHGKIIKIYIIIRYVSLDEIILLKNMELNFMQFLRRFVEIVKKDLDLKRSPFPYVTNDNFNIKIE